MDIESRISRRRRGDAAELILDYGDLSPVTHVAEPADRGPFLERLLDHLDPVFEGDLPENAYVWGPQGAGKSAVLSALFAHLRNLPDHADAVIHTATRSRPVSTPSFVSLDLREAASEFGLYHGLLDGLVEDPVPEHGVGTEEVCSRLSDRVADRPVVAVLDHVDEPATLDRATILDALEPFDGLRWICVGRDPPDRRGWDECDATALEVPAYRRQVLVDVVMDRASAGLATRVLAHDQAREIAEWADGNAHDALAALFAAADAAAAAGRDRIEPADVSTGIADVPRPSVSLGRVLALPSNRQSVLRELVGLDAADRATVMATTDAIAASDRIDLSPGTVKRFLYELAEAGILAREENTDADRQGRPPSRVEPRFPPTVFARLYDLQNS
ncbi:ATP-binding protein [Halobacteria archaeon HArc-gm2]|nr:ATP-binding protein [Halobacteria archaeon HArc-gm2]